jgi:tRNA 2-thiouridine synthesizing protein D
MKFAIQINASPYASGCGETAYQFIKATLAKKHQVFRVFFYFDAIYHAFQTMTPPDDEQHPGQQWSELAKNHNIDLVICISAAQRRGLLCEDEAKRQNRQDNDLADDFRISGLGQLVEAMLEADRFIVFR